MIKTDILGVINKPWKLWGGFQVHCRHCGRYKYIPGIANTVQMQKALIRLNWRQLGDYWHCPPCVRAMGMRKSPPDHA